MDEQQEMERWRRRMAFWREVARFFKESVMIDVVSPILGMGGAVILFVTRSDSLPAWMACIGAIGLSGVGPAAEAVARALSRRPSPGP